MGYLTKSILKNGTAQSVAQSTTEQVISTEPSSASAEDAKYFLYMVKCSALVVAEAVSFKLQHSSGDGVWYNVGSSANASAVQKTATLGTAEVTDITWPAFADATQADYVHVVAQDGTKYAVWLDKDANGTEPTGALYVAADVKIEVDIVTGDTAAQVAAKARAAVVANASWNLDFTTSAVATATFTATQLNTGAVTNAAPKSADDGGAGSITVSVTTAGADGGLNLSTEAITSTTHGYVTGDRVLISTAGTLPTGLTAGEVWVIRVDDNTLKLASTKALALAGTAIDMTTYGTGTLRICQADYTVRLLATDSTDVAQLPLWPTVRVVCDTGSGDSVTVSEIRRTYREQD